jgi:8-oxo-dGTP pyrophosphatase MutT (NUDIX family)
MTPRPDNAEVSEGVEYVVGFAFDTYGRVALIRKNRPEWQAGQLNGIGGHVETACERSDHINSRHDAACRGHLEDPYVAMVREFEEETGRRVEGWQKFVVMDFPGEARPEPVVAGAARGVHR